MKVTYYYYDEPSLASQTGDDVSSSGFILESSLPRYRSKSIAYDNDLGDSHQDMGSWRPTRS